MDINVAPTLEAGQPHEYYNSSKPCDGDEDQLHIFMNPHIGKSFASFDEAYNYYYNFAKRRGFSVQKNTTRMGDDDEYRLRTYVCSREGYKKWMK